MKEKKQSSISIFISIIIGVLLLFKIVGILNKTQNRNEYKTPEYEISPYSLQGYKLPESYNNDQEVLKIIEAWKKLNNKETDVLDKMEFDLFATSHITDFKRLINHAIYSNPTELNALHLSDQIKVCTIRRDLLTLKSRSDIEKTSDSDLQSQYYFVSIGLMRHSNIELIKFEYENEAFVIYNNEGVRMSAQFLKENGKWKVNPLQENPILISSKIEFLLANFGKMGNQILIMNLFIEVPNILNPLKEQN